MTPDVIRCETCDKPTEPAAFSPLQCQECWEAQCSQSWWEMIDTMNAIAHLELAVLKEQPCTPPT